MSSILLSQRNQHIIHHTEKLLANAFTEDWVGDDGGVVPWEADSLLNEESLSRQVELFGLLCIGIW